MPFIQLYRDAKGRPTGVDSGKDSPSVCCPYTDEDAQGFGQSAQYQFLPQKNHRDGTGIRTQLVEFCEAEFSLQL